MRSSSSGKALVWTVLTLVGALLIAEVGLRIRAARSPEPGAAVSRGGELSAFDLLRPSSHDDLVYELRPGARGMLGGRWVEINALGFRGREHQIEKESEAFRIVGLGDERMFGTGVAEGETFLDRLERRLGAAGERRYEALNFAAPGFNTNQQVAMFEHRAAGFDPDLVVVHFVGDDVGPPRFLSAAPPAEDAPTSYLIDAISGGRSRAEAPELVRATKASRELLEQAGGLDAPAGREAVVAALRRLAELAAEHEAPVIVVMLGDDGADRAAVRAAAESLGFSVVNALPRFHDHLIASGEQATKKAWRRAFFVGGDYPTPLAHRLYAEALFDRMVEMGLAPSGAEL